MRGKVSGYNIQDQVDEVLQGMQIGVAPPGKLTVTQGQTVRMTAGFNYRGPAINVTLYCSIGNNILGIFNEIAFGTKMVSLSQSSTFIPYTAFADILTGAIPIGTNYDIYCKIKEYPGAGTPQVDNVIDVIGGVEFANFVITDYSVV